MTPRKPLTRRQLKQPVQKMHELTETEIAVSFKPIKQTDVYLEARGLYFDLTRTGSKGRYLGTTEDLPQTPGEITRIS